VNGDFTAGVPGGWRVEWYDEPNQAWADRTGSNRLANVGRGFVVYAPDDDIAVKFKGVFNDGGLTDVPAGDRLTLDSRQTNPKKGFNLIGNPYPSYWRWTTATADKYELYSTIWYRTVVQDGTPEGRYEFWSYNASGDIAAHPGWENTEDATPTGAYSLSYIPPMQAFWVRMKGDAQFASTMLYFDNDLRSHADHGSNVLKSAEEDARPLLRLAVDNGIRTDETVIYADSRAAKEFDDYDSDKYFTNEGVEIYTQPASSTRELVINGYPEITEGLEIPLGFQAEEGGAFSFSAKELLNLDDLDVYLLDKWLKEEHNLRDGDYNFTAGSMPTADRFSIVFRSAGSGPVTEEQAEDNLLAYNSQEGQISIMLYLRNQEGEDAKVSVFDIAGRLISTQQVVVGERTALDGYFPRGVYVLRSGKCVTKVMVTR
jgi:hypothetical protein